MYCTHMYVYIYTCIYMYTCTHICIFLPDNFSKQLHLQQIRCTVLKLNSFSSAVVLLLDIAHKQ